MEFERVSKVNEGLDGMIDLFMFAIMSSFDLNDFLRKNEKI